MHAHHGFEEMDSQTGQGSTFRLVLPGEIGYRFDVPQ
jgi:signal transduction histidine kinase